MTKKRSLTFILILTLVLSVFADDIVQGMSARPEGNSVVVSFNTDSGKDVRAFILEKSVDTEDNYVKIHEFQPVSDAGHTYTFIDEVVWFRKITSSIIFYRIKIEYKDGRFAYGKTVMAVPGVNEIVKTWGSIKLLFR